MSDSKEGTLKPYLTTSNVYWNSFDFTEVKQMHFKDAELEKCTVTKGDLLVCEGGDIGRAAIWNYDYNICIQNHIHRLRASRDVCQLLYLYILMLYKWTDQIQGQGIGLQGLSSGLLDKLEVPLPPFEEQNRIVTAIEQWFKTIDNLDIDNNELKTVIQHTKTKILDLAIHGKLVPQDPNDEPAIELLKRINPRFEPRDKEHDTNQLPNSWCWTTLGSLFQHNTGKALNKSESQEGLLKPYLTTSNVYWNCFDFSEVKEMFFKDSELEKCTIIKGDLLVCEGGDIGRAAIWNYDYGICIQNHIHRLRAKGDVCQILYLYVLMLYKWTDKIHGKGIGLQGLSSGLLDKLVVPLPPYNEQFRIVAKIEELFAVLDEIQKSIEA